MKRKNFFVKLATLTAATLIMVSGLTACSGGSEDSGSVSDSKASFRTLDEIKEC